MSGPEGAAGAGVSAATGSPGGANTSTPPAASTASTVIPDGARPGQSDDETIREYAQLIRRNRQIDQEKRENNERLAALQKRVLSIFEERQQRAVDLIGIGNLHLIRVVRAKVIRQDGNYGRDATESEREKAKAALVAAGWTDLLKQAFNTNSVTGRVKETLEQKEPLPEGLEDGFYIDTSYDIGLEVKQ